MQTQKPSVAGTQGDITVAHAEPLKLTKRIGSTTFTVSVHFSKTSKETVEDKLLRLMERDVGEMYAQLTLEPPPIIQSEVTSPAMSEVSKSA